MNYIFGIGGTGMRCVESFMYACSIGMFPNQEFKIYLLETDTSNGNYQRTKALINNYIKVKGGKVSNKNNRDSGEGGTKYQEGFFTAKIEYETILLDYTTEGVGFKKFEDTLANLEKRSKNENQELADLLFDSKVQDFPLSKGYRGKPHLGSYLMYRYIIAQAKNGDKVISKLITNLSNGGKFFFMGSVFGGTGASSLPVLPQALKDAYESLNDGNLDGINDLKFGGVILTDYFTFNPPNRDKDEYKVAASANNFPISSQAALKYYNDSVNGIKKSFNRLYHIGWADLELSDYSSKNPAITLLGGEDQKNPVHVVELLSVSALHHFFLGNTNYSDTSEDFYKTGTKDPIKNKLRIEFNEIFEGKLGDKFKQNLTYFASMSLCFLGLGRDKKLGNIDYKCDVRNFVDFVIKSKVAEENDPFSDLKSLNQESGLRYDTTRLDALEEILTGFMGQEIYVTNESRYQVTDGWLHQLQRSVDDDEFLGYNKQLYSSNFRKLNYGSLRENNNENALIKKGHHDNVIVQTFKKFHDSNKENRDQHIEIFLERMYLSIKELYRLN